MSLNFDKCMDKLKKTANFEKYTKKLFKNVTIPKNVLTNFSKMLKFRVMY